MMSKEIIITDYANTLAKEAADYFFQLIVDAHAKNKKVFAAISGGSTPSGMFKKFAKKYGKESLLKNIHIFWVDERCVPPKSSESNYGNAKKYLLKKIDIPEENIHRIRGEDNPDEEAVRYTGEIKGIVPVHNGLPCFDIILLGIGEDGHFASIFPDRLDLIKTDEICAVSVYPKNGQKRITLTGSVINNAQEIVVLASGFSKADALSEVIKSKDYSGLMPAGYIKPVHGNITWLMDTDASVKLNSP
jgi:6-phosphogluconolactonase